MRRPYALIALTLWLSGCAVYTTPNVTRIALLAPFEGRYREVGYQALYAARMAIADTGRTDLELLAVDDGGSTETAHDRARALNNDPLVAAVMVLGVHAADETVVDTLEPYALVVGDWLPAVTAIADDAIAPPTAITDIAALDVPYICADLCLLASFPLLADDPTLATVVVHSPPVPDDFRERYINFDMFVPEPLPIAYQTYRTSQHVLSWVNGEATTEASAALTAETWTYTYTEAGELIIPEAAGDNVPAWIDDQAS